VVFATVIWTRAFQIDFFITQSITPFITLLFFTAFPRLKALGKPCDTGKLDYQTTLISE
jgi:hypothetical protein